ncbi:MAG: DUF4469 domain-containing protein [Prevotellaceae bacterium]|jgi:hypothetical protein|nr:DUF4469 domain-containing protein [Prevotellaceae bacterium]
MENFFLTLRDTVHTMTVKFVRTYLPTAKKPYNARVMLQTELDLYEIAEKAEIYDIGVSPQRIVEGVMAFITLCYYLSADGFKLKTPLFNSYMRIPGEYDGYETHLPEGVYPEIRMTPGVAYKEYIRERVNVMFDGIYDVNGLIGEVLDEVTGLKNETITVGNIIDIHGWGLKIAGDEEHADQIGFFFTSEATGDIQATVIPVNKPTLLKVLVPPLSAEDYFVVIRTQSSAKSARGVFLKNLREIKSVFTVTPA